MLLLIRKTPIHYFSKGLSNISLIFTIANNLDEHNVRRADRKKDILYRSYIVYLMATWQAFVEDVARESFEALIISEPNSIFHERLTANFNGFLENFSSPNTKNVNKLVELATGMKNISDSWHWEGVESKESEKKLDELWKIRCDIAHKGRSAKILSSETTMNNMKFMFNIGCCMNNAIGEYITSKTGEVIFYPRKLEYDHI